MSNFVDVLANFFDSSAICGFQLKVESIRTPRYLMQLTLLMGFEPSLILTNCQLYWLENEI